jgi:hypothetical protein
MTEWRCSHLGDRSKGAVFNTDRWVDAVQVAEHRRATYRYRSPCGKGVVGTARDPSLFTALVEERIDRVAREKLKELEFAEEAMGDLQLDTRFRDFGLACGDEFAQDRFWHHRGVVVKRQVEPDDRLIEFIVNQ